jgi:mycothiol synthase
VRPLAEDEDDVWIQVHRQSVPSFGESDLRAWLARYRQLALPDGILLAEDEATGTPAATAGSIANDRDGTFPGAGQLAWVATAPAARRRGFATWLSALALERLLADGYRRVFVCTGDDLLPAIRIYLRLGFVPCLYAPDQQERWAVICDQIAAPFEPERWPDVPAYRGDPGPTAAGRPP